MLASAAVASAEPAPPTAPASAIGTLPPAFDTTLAPPGMTEPILSPPGLTPPVDCQDDPEWDVRPACTVTNGVIRGGFGHYFRVGGG